MLKVGAHRIRGLTTKARHIHHRMDDGPHCHRIAYVPVPLFHFFAMTLPYESGAVPDGAIAEALATDTIEGALFAKWATERNARCCARLLREVGQRSEARAFQRRAADLRHFRKDAVKVIIGVFEERMPGYAR